MTFAPPFQPTNRDILAFLLSISLFYYKAARIMFHRGYNMVLFTLFHFVLPGRNAAENGDQSDACPPPTDPVILRSKPDKAETLLSPGYLSGSYLPNLDCNWILRASDPVNKISLKVEDTLLEDKLFTECDDFAEIRDGAKNDSRLIVKWCGKENPFYASSTSDSLFIRFKSDFLAEKRGFNISFTEYKIPGCSRGWIRFKTDCYRLEERHLATWVRAQYYCNHENSNLLSIGGLEEYQFIYSSFSDRNNSFWVGLTDVQQKGFFQNTDLSKVTWPNQCIGANDKNPCLPLTSDESKSCVFIDFKPDYSLYKIDDCESLHYFICKKKIDGYTAPYPPPEAAINGRRQRLETASMWNRPVIWIILAALILLLLLILVPCLKYKSYKSKMVKVSPQTNDLATGRETSPAEVPPTRYRLLHAAGSMTPILENPNEASRDHRTNAVNCSNLILGGPCPVVGQEPKIDSAIQTSFDVSAQGERTNDNAAALIDGPLVMVRPRSEDRTGSRGSLNGRFDRPRVHLLESASAISMDEFWRDMELPRLKKSDGSETTQPSRVNIA